MSKAPIAILGAGAMASSLAVILARHLRPIRFYCIEADVEEDIRTKSCNTKYLAGYRFPKQVTASNDLAAVLLDAEDVIVAVPSFAEREVVEAAKPFLTDNVKSILSITKGLDPDSLQPMAVMIADRLPRSLRARFCTLGGPAVAIEMAKGTPTGLIVAGPGKTAIKRVKELLESETIKCASSDDILGVGLASALKNTYAIALGFCDGLDYPTNTKAMLLTIALQEMDALIRKAGGRHESVVGLAGLGDLVVTGMSPHGRNRAYGERLVGARSNKPEDLRLGTVEGIACTTIAHALAKRLKVKAPLLDSIDQCLRSRENFERPFITYLNQLTLS